MKLLLCSIAIFPWSSSPLPGGIGMCGGVSELGNGADIFVHLKGINAWRKHGLERNSDALRSAWGNWTDVTQGYPVFRLPLPREFPRPF